MSHVRRGERGLGAYVTHLPQGLIRVLRVQVGQHQVREPPWEATSAMAWPTPDAALVTTTNFSFSMTLLTSKMATMDIDDCTPVQGRRQWR